MVEIELGDQVKCKITGFKGIATSRTEYINGCIQITVAPKVGKENKYPEEMVIDQGSLEVVGKKKKKVVKRDTGGPVHRAIKQRGY